jgi:hypothetical protein
MILGLTGEEQGGKTACIIFENSTKNQQQQGKIQ